MHTSSLCKRIRAAKHIYVVGNGGSYANAMHICNDLLSVGVKAYCMDPSILTAFANDHSYADCFSMWLAVVGEAGDMLIALSGSGKSENILRAIDQANIIGMDVEAVFGAPKYDMQSAEEHQIVLGHELMLELKRERS